MTVTKKRWLLVLAGLGVVVVAGLAITASVLSRRFEPFIREQAVLYMSERFNCDVELASLRIEMPKLSPISVLLNRGRGATARVLGEGISMRYKNAPADTPPLFKIQDFAVRVDLGTLFEPTKVVEEVVLDGMEIHVPPKEERRPLGKKEETTQAAGGGKPSVLIRKVVLKDAKLLILPKDRNKVPLDFVIDKVTLHSEGSG